MAIEKKDYRVNAPKSTPTISQKPEDYKLDAPISIRTISQKPEFQLRTIRNYDIWPDLKERNKALKQEKSPLDTTLMFR
jgi:hypothetical protein